MLCEVAVFKSFLSRSIGLSCTQTAFHQAFVFVEILNSHLAGVNPKFQNLILTDGLSLRLLQRVMLFAQPFLLAETERSDFVGASHTS